MTSPCSRDATSSSADSASPPPPPWRHAPHRRRGRRVCRRAPSAPPAPLSRPRANVSSRRLWWPAGRLDLGGRTVSTWAYDGTLPGRWSGPCRGLPAGVPGQPAPGRHHDPLARDPAAQRRRRRAGLTRTRSAPEPNTCTSSPHPTRAPTLPPHVGVQLDRGLYAPMIIDDRTKPATMTPSGSSSSMTGSTAPAPQPMTSSRNSSPTASRLLRRHGRMDHGSMGGMDHGSMGGMSMGTPPWEMPGT